jgi:hypothetical protein
LFYGYLPLRARDTAEIISNTRKMKNRILAISADAPAMPPNPKIPAIMARMKNKSE